MNKIDINGIKKRILETVNKYNTEIEATNNAYEFTDTFITKNNFSNIYDIIQINLYNLFLAMIFANDNVFNEVNDSKKELFFLFATNNYNSLMDFKDYIEKNVKELKEDEDYDDLYDQLVSCTDFNDDSKKEVKKHTTDESEIMDYAAITSLIRIAVLYDADVIKYLEIIASVKMLALETNKVNITSDFKLPKDKLREKDRKAIGKLIEKAYMDQNYSELEKNIVEFVNETVEKLINFKRDNDRHKKTLRKQIGILNETNQKLSASDLSKPIDIDINNVGKLIDENLKRFILINVYKHNFEIAKSKKDEYNSLYQTIGKYKLLFNKYNIDIDSYDIDLNSYDAAEMDTILRNLVEMGITSEEKIMYVISISSNNTINKIYEYFKKGIIDTDFLLNNINIFDKNNKNIHKNIELLNNNNVSQSNFISNQNILLENECVIKNNIDILSKYEFSINNTANLSFLNGNDIEEKLDRLLEYGLEYELIKNLDLLNYSLNNIKRIELVKKINPDISFEEIIEFLNFSGNYIDEIDEYIFNYLDTQEFEKEKNIEKEDFIKLISKYESNSKRTYCINGILISKNKVKKSLNNEDKLSKQDVYNILFSGISISLDEFNTINSELFDDKDCINSYNKLMVKI